MKKSFTAFVLMLLTIALLSQGCSSTKKNCDCPSFGGKGKGHRSGGPGW